MPKATTIPPDPAKFQGVIISIPCPNVMSDRKTRTIVSRLPTETTMGPQMPNNIYTSGSQGQSANLCAETKRTVTINPALKTSPEAAMPTIEMRVIVSEGRRNLSYPQK